MWNLKNKTHKYIQPNRNRLTDTENKLVVIHGEREAGRGKIGVWDREIKISMYKIPKQQGIYSMAQGSIAIIL